VRASAAALIVLCAGSVAAADAGPPAARLVVDFASATGGDWFPSALEELVARELSRFHSVALVDKIDARACPGREARCLVDRYRDAGVQVVVLGRLVRERLDYEVYATWLRGRAFDGSLAVAHVDTATLRRHLGDIVRPIVQRGGLVDERPTPAAAATAGAATTNGAPTAAAPTATAPTAAAPTTAAPTAAAPPAHHRLLAALLLAGLLLFVALPPLSAWLLVGKRQLAKRARPASWKWSGALLAALAALLAAVVFTDAPARLADQAARAGGAVDVVAALAAGLVWGAFVLVHATWVFSPLRGLGQARHDAIWPLLQSWLALAFLRACLLVVYVPLVWLTFAACESLGLPRRVTLSLALPSVGLVAYFWLLTLVDNLALYLDVHLVVGPATARNAWHATIKRYFRGYLRRNGVDVDAALFERTLFLPSLLPSVVSYGGGFARPRILVGEQARDAALGQLPDESELPERTVNPEELPWGLVAPSLGSAPRARDATLHERSADERRRVLTQAPARPRAAAPRVLGENATLLGWVMPQPADDGVPLIANTVEDFEVVKHLLTEHYAAFERNLDDDEIDDTDPTQKDFLFGALLREMSLVMSRDTFLSTLRLALGRGGNRIVGVYERFLSGPAARVADAYAALNQGLHQLIQYLSFVRGGADAWLTTRANAPRLIQTSKELLEHLDRAAIPTVERQLLAATPRNRLLWLSPLFHAPLGRRRDRGLRLAAVLTLALAAGVLLLFALRDAVDYHPIYVERMHSAAPTQGASSDERSTKQ